MVKMFNINKRRFIIAGTSSFTALILLVSSLIFSGSVYAALPLAGVGGFVIQADKITGENFQLVPSLTDTSVANKNQDTWTVYPQSQTTMDTVNIWGMKLFKNLDVSHLGFPVVSYVKVLIEADTSSKSVYGKGLIMDASQIEAGQVDFDNMEMDENMPVAPEFRNPTTPSSGNAEIGLLANTITLYNANINAHYMKVSSMSIPGMKLSIKLYDSNNNELSPSALGKHTAPWDNQ